MSPAIVPPSDLLCLKLLCCRLELSQPLLYARALLGEQLMAALHVLPQHHDREAPRQREPAKEAVHSRSHHGKHHSGQPKPSSKRKPTAAAVSRGASSRRPTLLPIEVSLGSLQQSKSRARESLHTTQPPRASPAGGAAVRRNENRALALDVSVQIDRIVAASGERSFDVLFVPHGQ